ncbi:MAG: signal peptidase I [bacterium]
MNKKAILEYILWIGLFFTVKTAVVEAYMIPSASMEDTLLEGDFLIANKFVYGARLPLIDYRLPEINKPQAGDVVIFIFPGDRQTKYIKRCVAVGGDTVEVKEKQLYVNSKLIPDTEFAKHIDTDIYGRQNIQPRVSPNRNSRDNFGPYLVPENSYFMMGDNRDNSYDSRYWGVVDDDLIIGKAMLIHWSWDDTVSPGKEVSIEDPLSVPSLFIHNTIHFFQKVRWNRIFSAIS